MNPKLIALLIRSNALMIEALKMADANAQTRDGGPYVHETSEFNNLVADCELLAKEAEETADTTQTEIQINGGMGISIENLKTAAKEGAESAFAQLSKGIQPMVPISPAHELKYQPLKIQDIAVDRIYTGKSANTGQTYTAGIKVVDTAFGPYGKQVTVMTTMLSIEGKPVSPFERPMTEDALFKEFVCWEK